LPFFVSAVSAPAREGADEIANREVFTREQAINAELSGWGYSGAVPVKATALPGGDPAVGDRRRHRDVRLCPSGWGN